MPAASSASAKPTKCQEAARAEFRAELKRLRETPRIRLLVVNDPGGPLARLAAFQARMNALLAEERANLLALTAEGRAALGGL